MKSDSSCILKRGNLLRYKMTAQRILLTQLMLYTLTTQTKACQIMSNHINNKEQNVRFICQIMARRNRHKKKCLKKKNQLAPSSGQKKQLRANLALFTQFTLCNHYLSICNTFIGDCFTFHTCLACGTKFLFQLYK